MYPLQIYHKNSDICKGIYNLSIDIKTIVIFVIENGPNCDNRDSFGHSYRLRINFNQPQSTNSTSSRYYDEKKVICLPHFSDKYLNKMTLTVKHDIGKLMEYAQLIMNKLYGEEEMNDKERNKIFGKYMAKQFYQSNKSNFEFIEIYVQTGCMLNKHMDYENDIGSYRYGCSYSEIHLHNNITYIINF